LLAIVNGSAADVKRGSRRLTLEPDARASDADREAAVALASGLLWVFWTGSLTAYVGLAALVFVLSMRAILRANRHERA
jgi:hypothetical protein